MGDQNSCTPLWRLLVSGKCRKEQPDCASDGQVLQTRDVIKRLPDSNVGGIYHFECNGSNSDELVPPGVGSSDFVADRITSLDAGEVIEAQKAVRADKELSVYSDEMEDAEFAACVLNNLPTSYDDFETKELHMKLERNISSPLVACQSPVIDSGLVSTGSSLTKSSVVHCCDNINVPPDADDLEVAMINETFEEQQKQNQLYASPGLKDLFYSQPNIRDGRFAAKENNGLTQSAETQPHVDPNEITFVDLLVSSSFASDSVFAVKHPSIFGSPDACVPFCQGSIYDMQQKQRERNTVADYKMKCLFVDDDDDDDDTLHKVPERVYDRAVELKQDTGGAISGREFLQQAEMIPDDGMEATKALAHNVVESLFEGTNTSSEDRNTEKEVPCTRGDNKIGKAEESHARKSVKERFESQKMHSLRTSEDKKADESKALSKNPDSWEDFDSDDVNLKVMEIQMAMSKVELDRPTRAECVVPPKNEEWDGKILPHVLEAHGFPADYISDDVLRLLAKYDCADVTLHPVDNQRYLVVFSSPSAALRAQMAIKESCCAVERIHLRPLRDASAKSREKALKLREFLKTNQPRPLTTSAVARRLVERALGRRSVVSSEQIIAEKAALESAKESKRTKAAIWDGNF